MSGAIPAEYYTAFNHYQTMWLFCFFDLPTETKAQRKAAALFRKGLLKDGFTMLQYSVYIRHCASRESGDVHLRRVKYMTPSEGAISVLSVTDKQFGQMVTIYGEKAKPPPPEPIQLELF